MKESDNIHKEDNNNQNIDISFSSENIEKKYETLSTSLNIMVNQKINVTSETIQIKPEKSKSEFEIHIIEAYKIITGFYEKQKGQTKKEDFKKEQRKMKIQLCEKEMRISLNKCIESPQIELNKNILDKISRIIRHNKVNILLIIGKIFINLMNREKLFDPSNKNLDLNIIIFFINEIYNLNSILKETYLGNKLNHISIKFIEKIIADFHFENDQFSAMKKLLNIYSEKQKLFNLNLNSLEEMILSINDLEECQENYYMQYKIILNNYEYIIGMLNQVDLDERSNLNNYLELGKIFVQLLYNKKYVILMKKQTNENENQGVIKLLFDGNEDNYQFNVIEGEKYYIDYDEEIDQMREKICELIIKYLEKNKSISNIFEFQYLLYILIKRIYFIYDKYKEKVEPILSEIMINLCFYKVDIIEEVKIFINEVLNSKDPKDNNLKNLLNRKIDFVKMNPNFQYQQFSKNENEENNNNYFKNIESITNETILLLESDLKLGYFITKKINSGDKFSFYVELTEPYGLIDFCANIEEYNIHLSISNLTEGNEIIEENEISLLSSPYKIIMFFTKPVILKFKFDNSYSWIRSKLIKYKVNIFYPQIPFYIAKQILLLKYQETLYNKKNNNEEERSKNKDDKNKDKDNSSKYMFIIKFNGQNKAYNSLEVMKNIEIFNKLIEDNFISINSIFIEKNIDKNNNTYFYYYNKNKLIQIELTKENFSNYIKNNILNTSNSEIDLINLYIISGDSNIIDNHYITIEEILGFIPDIGTDEETDNYNNYKILFFIQYLHQSQIIFSLYKFFCNKESYDIVLLINYTKYGGYQICLYKDGEIIINPKNYKCINKSESIKKNIELIIEEIKKFGSERRIDILIAESIDGEEEDFNPESIAKLFKEKLNITNEDESNYKIRIMNNEFNNEISKYSHIFYLD